MTTLYDIGRWYENRGLVGEKKLAITQTTVAISGKPIGFGLIAPAGSGKSVTMDLLVGDADDKDDALIKKKYVFFKDAGSEKAFWYDKTINDKKIIVFKELQKDNSQDTIEAVKSLTEGKSARRTVTVAAEDTVKEQKLDPKTVLFTYAIENKDVKFDTELARRCITMSTDISKSQTQNVINVKAQLRWDKSATTILTEEQSETIRTDVNSLLTSKINVANPYAVPFAPIIANFAPDQKVRSSISHFWDVNDGVTKINWKNNTWADADTILANVQDLYMTLDIYKESFIRDMYGIPPQGDVVLQGFEDCRLVSETEKGPSSGNLGAFGVGESSAQWYTVNHIRKAIKEKQNIVLKTNVVIGICRDLVDRGYLEDWKDGRETKYCVQDKYEEFAQPDWEKMVEQAAELVREKYPAKFDEWYAKQYEDYVHPITGEVVKAPPRKTALDELEEDLM